NRDRRNKNIALDVAFQDLPRIAHPRWKGCRIIDCDVPLPIFQRVELAVAIADQLLDFVWQFAGMRLSAIERRKFMAAAERVTNLIRPDESSPTQNENAQRFRRFLRE